MFRNIKKMFDSFVQEEAGLAMTEYLILLGMLAGTAIAAVAVVGANLESTWLSWAAWFTDVLIPKITNLTESS